ncbi:unnamed protein product, partial [Durusdinium trenchii]
EKIWITRRGPFNLAAQRAVEWAPLVPCFGSGVVAALLSKYMPKQVKSLRLPISVHELTALPLSILLAFRFQLSYERWWASRQHLQEVGTNAIAVAMCSANNQEVISLDRSGEAKPDVPWLKKSKRTSAECSDFLTQRAALLSKLCPLDVLHILPTVWKNGSRLIHICTRMMLSKSDNLDILYIAALMPFSPPFTGGQMLNVYSAELASGMYQLASNMFAGYKFCEMILTQPNPAPFAVHMRTILMVFCISFPFTIIGRVSPLSLMLMQSALSFSLLGIEFVSRQMEHPFGSDEYRRWQVPRHQALFVGGVPPEMASQEIEEHMGKYGEARVVKRCRGYVYVRLEDPEVRLSMELQMNLVQQVMSLGGGSAGFYTPRFEGREMKLQTFCLGRHWDTRSHEYCDARLDHDNLPVLALPSNLSELAQGILSDLDQKCGEVIFPKMEPDTCIVNHYSASGSLGLHQDSDESEASISAGIPVLSMSFGCSARFLFGDDGNSLRSTMLRSGDVFIFGNSARLLQHGIAKVFPRTVPKRLKEILKGRLNLTLRQTEVD